MDRNHTGRVIHLEELAAYSRVLALAYAEDLQRSCRISLGKYIRQRRLAGAVNALRRSEQTIFDIALILVSGSQISFHLYVPQRI